MTVDVERERGITIETRRTDGIRPATGKLHLAQLIRLTRFTSISHYEVSRAIAWCEGGLLVVDATQGA